LDWFCLLGKVKPLRPNLILVDLVVQLFGRTSTSYAWKGIILFIAVSLVGCAAKRAVNDGDEARERGNTFVAANHYLDALDEKAGHEEALSKLSNVAEAGYEQKLELAEGFEDQGNLKSALQEYEQLQRYIRRLRGHDALTFAPINIEEAIQTASAGVAEQHYKRAEGYFGEGQYEQAIQQYNQALDYTQPYKNATGRIAESYYRMATRAVKASQYRQAADTYLRASGEVEGYKDAQERAASLYYHLGGHFLAEGHCRKAYEEFDTADTIISGYENVSAKMSAAKDCATVRIAFARFENTTRRSLAGMNLGDVIFERTRMNTLNQASQFIEILTRERLSVLMEEQEMGGGMVSDASSIPRGFEGADYVVFGKLNQVLVENEELTQERKRATYEYAYQETYTNSEGERETRTEWTERYLAFVENRDARTIKLGGTMRVVDVDSREVTISHSIDRQNRDAVRYATNIRAEHDLSADNVRLDSDFVQLANAREELKSVDALTDNMLDAISGEIANQILGRLDRTRSVSDPSSLDISFRSVAESGD
jgi:tetratricopeptide (TPR) repeat protein